MNFVYLCFRYMALLQIIVGGFYDVSPMTYHAANPSNVVLCMHCFGFIVQYRCFGALLLIFWSFLVAFKELGIFLQQPSDFWSRGPGTRIYIPMPNFLRFVRFQERFDLTPFMEAPARNARVG